MQRLKLFGSRRRTEVLILTALLRETYPTELNALLKARLYAIQEVVKSLEAEGVLATRLIGKERRVSLNPRFFAYDELESLLAKLAEGEPQLMEAAMSLRRRPGRSSVAS